MDEGDLGYAAALGSAPRVSLEPNACASGLVWIDLADPSNPTSPGCAGNDGYVHDAQCVIYHGPDERYEDQGVDDRRRSRERFRNRGDDERDMDPL